jgi:Fe-S-cluster containining protein
MSSDDPVSRKELERGLRFLNNAVTQMRDELLQLGAQVVTLTRLLEERDSVKQADVMEALPAAVRDVRENDEESPPNRVELRETLCDKQDVLSPPIPCGELLHLCKARCCRLVFLLSTQDLEERVLRWDYGKPYWNLRREDGYCVHNQPGTHQCGVYQQRPTPCRIFDCRRDKRIWTDYDQRIPAPDRDEELLELAPRPTPEQVTERARARHNAMEVEDAALHFKR